MKDDFGDAFDASRRYAGIPLESGEVAADNDWNAGGDSGAGMPPAGGDTVDMLGADRFVRGDDAGMRLGLLELLRSDAPVPLTPDTPAAVENSGSPAAGDSDSPPAGTGKTLSAEILAGALHLADLGLDTLVRQYIGETEKNLAQVLGQDGDPSRTAERVPIEEQLFSEDHPPRTRRDP